MARERWHAVLSGMRNPGQQVLELVFISSQPLDPATVEQRFANDIQHIVVVSGRGDSSAYAAHRWQATDGADNGIRTEFTKWEQN